MMWLIPILFICLNPLVWREALKSREELNVFLFFQGARVLFGIIYLLVIEYVFLVDHNISAFFIWAAFPVTILGIYDLVTKVQNYDGGWFSLIISLVVGASLVFMLIIYPATIYEDLFNLVKAKTSAERLENMNVEHIPVVPYKFAYYKASKLVGKIPNFSYYQVEDGMIQKQEGELYWIFPVGFNGYFTSGRAGEIPGYIRVSAEDKDKDAELLLGYHMKYVPSAYFGDNLVRMVRKKYPNLIIFGISFEPDDNRKPYYVVSYGHYSNFRFGKVVDGIILFDPETGNMQQKTMDQIPEFVDQVIPVNVANAYNTYQGEYGGGFWNRNFYKTGIHSPTVWEDGGDEVIAVFGKDRKMMWFTDHTTADDNANHNSMVGYSMMDARNGKFTYYTGANGFLNGKAVLDVVNKTLKNLQWEGASPSLFNVYDHDTWVVPVVDGNGFMREIALVHAETGNLVHATTKKDVFEQYKYMLATKITNGKVVPTQVSAIKQISGKVLRVISVSNTEGTILKVLLTDSAKVFNVDCVKNIYAPFTKEGDSVSMKYIDTDEPIVNVQEFKNITLNK